MSERVAIIGAGLLGCSFALAYRQCNPDADFVGVSRSQASLNEALQSLTSFNVTTDVDEACAGADLVVVAVPVDGIVSMVLRAIKNCNADALVIDLGSTKSSIVRAIDQHEQASQMFVGTHPIAGSEKTGAMWSREDLFKGRTVIITPSERTLPSRIERTEAIWRSFDCKLVRMTPEEHDVAMATVSHVPHLAASMLASLLTPEASQLVGSGWIDTTRVASGDAELWTAICRENALAILRELRLASDWLDKIASAIRDSDFATVHQMLDEAKRIRDATLP